VIDPVDIQELLDREPFQPFRIRMSDGNAYEVTNPALVVPMETNLFIALPRDRWKFLSYLNMTSVENREQRRRGTKAQR
jgi:hypothetical protein